MLLGAPPHHNTGEFKSHRIRLPDKEYGEALDCLVKACSDMLLLSPDGSKIFLGKRLVQPQVCVCVQRFHGDCVARAENMALALFVLLNILRGALLR